MIDPTAFAEAWIETEDGRCLPLRGSCRLGRNPDCDIIINGAKASRRHALIHAQDEAEFWLIDLGSLNGTHLNEKRVLHPIRLRDGDRLKLAGAVFHFRQPGGGQRSTFTTATTTTTTTTAAGSSGKATVMDLVDRDAWLLIVDIESFITLSRSLPPDQLAVHVGSLIKKSQRLVEASGGRISKFLGDGFLACWESAENTARSVAGALDAFHTLREIGPIKFRVVVHHGTVTFGGAVQLGEENMIGPELNYIFRLEHLASELGVTYCASAPAHPRLQPLLPMIAVPGEHELKGYPGLHRCYSIHWGNSSCATAAPPAPANTRTPP